MSQDLNPVIWPLSARRVSGEITIGDISVSDLADELKDRYSTFENISGEAQT